MIRAYARVFPRIPIITPNMTEPLPLFVLITTEMGGCKSHQCNEIAKEIWDWARVTNLWLSAAHIPWCNNVGADESSLNFNMKLEWMFSKQVFQKILSHFDDLQIDLFASRLNAQLQNYVSWKPDSMAKHIDAFCVNWSQYVFYAFPPFCLISRCVQKIVQEQATGVLVIPMWPSQAYSCSNEPSHRHSPISESVCQKPCSPETELSSCTKSQFSTDGLQIIRQSLSK